MRRINIHLTLDQKTLRYCQEVNLAIRNITESIIIFDKFSPMIPHVTLIMGDFDEQKHNLGEMEIELKKLVTSLSSPVRITVTEPYIETLLNQYVFSDAVIDDNILSFRSKLRTLIENLYLSSVQESSDKFPHITLGHITQEHDLVSEFLSTVKADFELISPAIEISDVGKKGTCINSLLRIPLNLPLSVAK